MQSQSLALGEPLLLEAAAGHASHNGKKRKFVGVVCLSCAFLSHVPRTNRSGLSVIQERVVTMPLSVHRWRHRRMQRCFWQQLPPCGSRRQIYPIQSSSWSGGDEDLEKLVDSIEQIDLRGRITDYDDCQEDYPLQSYEEGELSEFVTTRSGLKMPRLIYGDAQKITRVKDFTLGALGTGFRGFEAGGQPTHIYEPGMGTAFRMLFAEPLHVARGITRDQVYIQTKVDRNRTEWPLEKQVVESVEKSLAHLGIEYIDCLVLTLPDFNHDVTMKGWRAMEEAVLSGKVRHLAISNILAVSRLQKIYDDAIIKPAFVQQRRNNEGASRHGEIRKWCAKVGIHFQSWWNIAAASTLYENVLFRKLAAKYGVKPQVLLLRSQLGQMVVSISSAASVAEMQEHRSALKVNLTRQDAERIDDLLDVEGQLPGRAEWRLAYINPETYGYMQDPSRPDGIREDGAL